MPNLTADPSDGRPGLGLSSGGYAVRHSGEAGGWLTSSRRLGRVEIGRIATGHEGFRPWPAGRPPHPWAAGRPGRFERVKIMSRDEPSGAPSVFPSSEIQEFAALLHELADWLGSIKEQGEQEATRRRIERALHLGRAIRQTISCTGSYPTKPAIGRVSVSGIVWGQPTEPGEMLIHRDPKGLTGHEADVLALVNEAGGHISKVRYWWSSSRGRLSDSEKDVKRKQDVFDEAKGRLRPIAEMLRDYCGTGHRVGPDRVQRNHEREESMTPRRRPTFLDGLSTEGFLDGLPDLGLPSHDQSQREQRQEPDPLREAWCRLPEWGACWPEVCNRFDAARDQVFRYFTNPKIEEYWCARIAEAAASAGSPCLFPELPDWSHDKAKVYAAMAICTQVFYPHETLVPKSIQATEWYKSNQDLYAWVRKADEAHVWMIRIDGDLRERGLLGHQGETPGSPNGKLPDGGNLQTKPTPADGQGISRQVTTGSESKSPDPEDTQTKANDSSVNAMDGEARALAVLVKHPDWSDTKIAKEAKVSRTTLYRYPRFRAARATARDGGKASLPKGYKEQDGSLEAYD